MFIWKSKLICKQNFKKFGGGSYLWEEAVHVFSGDAVCCVIYIQACLKHTVFYSLFFIPMFVLNKKLKWLISFCGYAYNLPAVYEFLSRCIINHYNACFPIIIT